LLSHAILVLIIVQHYDLSASLSSISFSNKSPFPYDSTPSIKSLNINRL
jgi:hypothetical protein